MMAKSGGLRIQTSSLPGSHVIHDSELDRWSMTDTCLNGRQNHKNFAPTDMKLRRQRYAASTIEG